MSFSNPSRAQSSPPFATFSPPLRDATSKKLETAVETAVETARAFEERDRATPEKFERASSGGKRENTRIVGIDCVAAQVDSDNVGAGRGIDIPKLNLGIQYSNTGGRGAESEGSNQSEWLESPVECEK